MGLWVSRKSIFSQSLDNKIMYWKSIKKRDKMVFLINNNYFIYNKKSFKNIWNG